jgi:hypothetical protein
MDNATAASVKAILTSSLSKTLGRRADEDPYDPERFRLTSPFHSRLVPDAIWKASKFERSFVTSIGQGVFEQVAVYIAKGVGNKAEQGHRQNGLIWKGQQDQIASIITGIRSKKEPPNWEKEVAAVIASKGIGTQIETSVISDVYIKRKDKSEYFYSFKTVLPNLDQTAKAKEDSLTLKAMSPAYNAIFALPYNPYISRQEYKWSHANKVFNMRLDPCVLIGEELWDQIGGNGTYKELLEIFEEVGAEFKAKIQKYLDS